MNKQDSRQSAPGQVMILFAVGLIALVGMVALAVDVGYLLAERRQNQAAVDSAAMAAAKSMLDGSDSDVVPSGQDYGAANAGVSESDVLVEWPAPGSGPFTGADFVRVTITKDVQKYFLGAVYDGDWQVTNTAVAGIDTVTKPYALVALNCPGIALNGGIQVNIGGSGSAMSNCDITNSGNSSIFSVGGSIDAVGTIEDNEQWVAPDKINPGTTAAPDPLAGATKPDKSDYNEVTLPACLTSNDATCVIGPGSYTDKSFTVKNTVCMLPGVYYLDGDTTISFQNTNSTLTNLQPHSIPGTTQCPSDSGVGDGVLIYIAPNSTASIVMGNGKLDISTSYPALETPPDSGSACGSSGGPYPGATCGMVFWIDNGSSFVSSGNAVAKFEGVIYAPDSYVQLQGTPGSNGLQVIVGELALGGNAAFNIEYRQYVQLDRPGVYLVQ